MNALNLCDIKALDMKLSQAASPVIVTHMKPDGDAMGSSIAMYHILKLYGKACKIAISDRFPSNLEFIADTISSDDLIIYEENPQRAESALSSSDLIICLDFNAFHRTDKLEDALTASSAEKVLIDHHLSPDTEQFSLIFSETEISSASELLYNILLQLPPIGEDAARIPAEAATALMTGMTTDTNNFANSVYPSTLMMASSLLAVGVDRNMILQNIYNSFGECRMRLMGHILKDLMRITPDGVAYMILDSRTQKEYNVSEGDTEGFVNLPLSIKKVVMSLLLKEDGDRVRVSIRSKKGISANRCARTNFNGGGHENAAGGRLYIGKEIESIADAEAYIEKYTHIFMSEENEN